MRGEDGTLRDEKESAMKYTGQREATMDCYNLGEWTVFPLTESEVEKNIGQVHQLMGQSLQRKDSYQTATLFVEMFYIFYCSHINGKMD